MARQQTSPSPLKGEGGEGVIHASTMVSTSFLLRNIPWRSRALWLRIGYGATALWMVAILVLTGEDVHDPLFRLIFDVPLAGWIIGVIAARLIARRWPAERQRDDRRPRP